MFPACKRFYPRIPTYIYTLRKNGALQLALIPGPVAAPRSRRARNHNDGGVQTDVESTRAKKQTQTESEASGLFCFFPPRSASWRGSIQSSIPGRLGNNRRILYCVFFQPGDHSFLSHKTLLSTASESVCYFFFFFSELSLVSQLELRLMRGRTNRDVPDGRARNSAASLTQLLAEARK